MGGIHLPGRIVHEHDLDSVVLNLRTKPFSDERTPVEVGISLAETIPTGINTANKNCSSCTAYEFALVARNVATAMPGYKGDVLGYAGFMENAGIARLDPRFLELSMLTTDPDHFKSGIAKILLLQSVKLANGRDMQLVGEPKKPGQGDSRYPLTTDQLRAMYLRAGAREFTPDEIKQYGEQVHMEVLVMDLTQKGYDPLTGEIGAPQYRPVTAEDHALFEGISYQERRDLMLNLMMQRFGSQPERIIGELDRTRTCNEQYIAKHVIADQV